VDDREKIAQVIRDNVHDDGHWRPLDVADAVLAAIGDRLLPELPKGWSWAAVDNERGEYWVAMVSEDGFKVGASGMTIAGAMRRVKSLLDGQHG
jgi:hypothetical protein